MPDPEVFVDWAKDRGIVGSHEELCQNPVCLINLKFITHNPFYISLSVCTVRIPKQPTGFVIFQQDVKKAVLEDMRAVGKEAGLKSFEQVRSLLPLINICQQ